MKNPGKYILSLPGGKYVLLLLFAAASIGFGVGVVVGAEEAEAVEAAEAQRHRSTPSPFGVPAVSQRQLGPGGPCCVADGECVRVTRTECQARGGYYAGDGFGCGSIGQNIPFCAVGSCCFGSADAVECKPVYARQCFDEPLAFDSFVLGGNCSDDMTCLRGACCTQFGGCRSNVYKGRCESEEESDILEFFNGTFLGNGTECGGEEDICGCQDGNEDICGALDLPCGQECNYDFQCDSKCCFTREQLKFRKPNDPRCPAGNKRPVGESCNLTDVTCSYGWDCDCCGKCKYEIGCTCQNGEWDCSDSDCDDSACPQPVGQCTVNEWCECADQVQGEGGQLRDFLHCVDECTI